MQGLHVWPLGQVSSREDAIGPRSYASVSSIVVSTSRCGRDIPGSNPGWRKTPVAKLSQPGPKHTTTFTQTSFFLIFFLI